ncbi:alanine--tRNA ligase [Allopseudospirillum japonicum]|uniref:alanine--tRNA ligase n=1 Tax=Allopseudospirillum japonicum TaxID=64971 RepID=UPI000B8739D4
MNSTQIRQCFLDYFSQHLVHHLSPSSPLIPAQDPTLLFTNAGMNPFKDIFLGLEKADFTRATSSQKCLRAGGKHNDLDNVGYTARHHTFFEMLGNFSFGDYFKKEAIRFAWDFLTSETWLNLPQERLWVTVYADDDQAYQIWQQEIGLAPERIIRIGDNKGARYASDNFWAMGDTGPCGPCSEIFYDHGEQVWGGLPGTPEEDGDRYMEIWNIVFMQYNRTSEGELQPLPKPSIDTGMGLERLCAVVQGVTDNYDTDLFVPLRQAAAALLSDTPETLLQDAKARPSLNVLADHIRAVSFLLAEGVRPSADGRGYVLRRIIRRACRHGHKLGAQGTFLHALVPALIQVMGSAYPELVTEADNIQAAIRAEEEQFAKTLSQGMRLLEEALQAPNEQTPPCLAGELIFKLYDTYGFPVDLTADMARERGWQIDEAGFEAAMEQQKARARAASHFSVDYTKLIRSDQPSEFCGYQQLQISAQITGLFQGDQACDTLEAGQSGAVILNQTPFYAESGGQVGDIGTLRTAEGACFRVTDTQKAGAAWIHYGDLLEGSLQAHTQVEAYVDAQQRASTAANHSATHLLHAALRQVLGAHVQQKGSKVDAHTLRFDFSHPQAVTAAELQQIQALVNAQIQANTPVNTQVTDIETAKQLGALALFGEKYGDQVRVLSMGLAETQDQAFSVELCGGTHVGHTGDIGVFHIVHEGGVASGIRRIEAVTGATALQYLYEPLQQVQALAGLLKVASTQDVLPRVENLLQRQRELERECEQLKLKLATGGGQGSPLAAAQDIQGIKVLAQAFEGVDVKTLRLTLDQLKQSAQEHACALLLASIYEDKVLLIAGVNASAQDLGLHAGKLIQQASAQVGGKGGGRADMAQGGGTDASQLDICLEKFPAWVQQMLAK